jgi:tetratricopeptide (TPR) repeat protein
MSRVADWNAAVAERDDVSRRRADQLRDLGRWQAAADTYAAVLAEDPDDDDARAGYGLALACLGEPEAAIAEFDRVLGSSPGHFLARYHRAITSPALGRDDRARADLDHLIDSGGDEFYLWSDRVCCG